MTNNQLQILLAGFPAEAKVAWSDPNFGGMYNLQDLSPSNINYENGVILIDFPFEEEVE